MGRRGPRRIRLFVKSLIVDRLHNGDFAQSLLAVHTLDIERFPRNSGVGRWPWSRSLPNGITRLGCWSISRVGVTRDIIVQKSPRLHRPSCLSVAQRVPVWGLGDMCREWKSWGLIVARWMAWGHSMFHLGGWSYAVVGGSVGQQWSRLELCVGLDENVMDVWTFTYRIRSAKRAEIWWRFHRIICTWCSRATGSTIITTSNNMWMPPSAIYKTSWFTHRSGVEFHGCGCSHCLPSAMSAARVQVLIKPKATLHASFIFSKGCKDRTRSATAALEHPKNIMARSWLANNVLIMSKHRLLEEVS